MYVKPLVHLRHITRQAKTHAPLSLLHKKMKFSMQIWSHLLKKSLMENFVFCAVPPATEQYLNKK